MEDIHDRYERLLAPSAALVEDIARINGDIMILGAGGKMGPALAKLARQAILKADIRKRVIAVSRFQDTEVVSELEEEGVEVIPADLLEDRALQALPEIPNILYLAGTKFGTVGNEPYTWAMNAYLPGRVAARFLHSNIVTFSTGNVYALSEVVDGGSVESDTPAPIGEYGQSCLGRERLFQYHSAKNNTPVLIYRLNYANDVSYGVLLEIGKSVMAGKSLDLSMGSVNVIWQGDANEIAIRCLLHCESPAKILNVTGPEVLSVRSIAEQFAEIFERAAIFINEEQPNALLSNSAESVRLFGRPLVSPDTMIRLVADWILQGGKTISKETHFQERQGKY